MARDPDKRGPDKRGLTVPEDTGLNNPFGICTNGNARVETNDTDEEIATVALLEVHEQVLTLVGVFLTSSRRSNNSPDVNKMELRCCTITDAKCRSSS